MCIEWSWGHVGPWRIHLLGPLVAQSSLKREQAHHTAVTQSVFKRNLWTYKDGSRNSPTPPSAASAADDSKWRRRAAAENWLKAFSFPTFSLSLWRNLWSLLWCREQQSPVFTFSVGFPWSMPLKERGWFANKFADYDLVLTSVVLFLFVLFCFWGGNNFKLKWGSLNLQENLEVKKL